MHFVIDNAPPSERELQAERDRLSSEISRISSRDTTITFILIIICSVGLGAIVYWSTDSVTYAGIASAVFSVLGIILSILGITKNAGFRSAAHKLTNLKNDLISVSPASSESQKDVVKLCAKYDIVSAYSNKLKEIERDMVNGELAMYWEYDTSTLAKTARGRAFLDKAKDTVVSRDDMA